MLACEIVRLVPPVLKNVPVTVWLLPTVMLPKLKLAGLEASSPLTTAIADSCNVVGELGASLEIKTVPLGNPGAVGVKEIERIVCWPGANVKGNVGAVTAN
jgi:hypothetical protein